MQFNYRGNIEAVAIFWEESHARAAEQYFEQQFGDSSLLRFKPKILILSRVKESDLLRLDDIHLTPLGIQQMLTKQIATRFGAIPENLRAKIQATNNPERLEQIATSLFTVQSVEELQASLN